ncbi:hypothetical protein HAX54_037773 [Datura stramonium]|uniref:Uncharacterized protein n=1 Tax=Datura stramonium TaxID=4076 RepID=A0ABS8RMP9_DATST|nr:hypothetical protein [Datura stramonium]
MGFLERFPGSNGVVCPKPRRGGHGLFNFASVQPTNPLSPILHCSKSSTASNPLIQDVHFGDNNFAAPIPPIPKSATPSPPFSSSGRVTGGGCVRMKFGNNSAPVKIEGFNCRGISAVA